MRMPHAAAVPANLILVEQRHHRAAQRPEQELEAEDQPDPFMDAPEERRRQPDALHAFFLLRRGKDQISNQAPVKSEEHTSELQSLMRTSYAGFCLKKKKQIIHH